MGNTLSFLSISPFGGWARVLTSSQESFLFIECTSIGYDVQGTCIPIQFVSFLLFSTPLHCVGHNLLLDASQSLVQFLSCIVQTWDLLSYYYNYSYFEL